MADRVIPLSSSPLPADLDSSALLPRRKPDLPESIPLSQNGERLSAGDRAVGKQDPKQVISGLRSLVAHGNLDLDALLQRIADTARALTGATGAAIAIRRDRLVICQARAGETAPDLGTKLDVDSGISGECLRTGRSLRCDDTSKDLRVDAEVCARLGLRSLAAAPIGEKRGIAGIIEVFSSRPYSFPDRHLQLLEQLAQLIAAARARASEPEKPTAASELPTPSSVRAALASRFASRASVLGNYARGVLIRSISTRRRQITVAGIATIFLLSALVWVFWNGHSRVTNLATGTAEAAARNSESLAPDAETALVWNGSVAKNQVGTRAKPSAGLTVGSAAKNRRKDFAEDMVVRPEQPAGDSAKVSSRTITSAQTSQSTLPGPPVAQVRDNPPLLSGTDSSPERTTTLASMLSAPALLPQPMTRVSQGLSAGVVEHRVKPTYPSQALTMRLQGPVVLRAMIAEDGSVHDLKVVSGQPVLARAALDAVRQWRYRPYRLDGTPVRMQTEITVDFKLP